MTIDCLCRAIDPVLRPNKLKDYKDVLAWSGMFKLAEDHMSWHSAGPSRVLQESGRDAVSLVECNIATAAVAVSPLAPLPHVGASDDICKRDAVRHVSVFLARHHVHKAKALMLRCSASTPTSCSEVCFEENFHVCSL